MTWRHYAACRGHDPELFFPVGVTGPALEQVAKAKAVCADCPVRCLCLEWAVLTGIDDGVWGGLSEEERRAMKVRARRRSLVNGRAPTFPVTTTRATA